MSVHPPDDPQTGTQSVPIPAAPPYPERVQLPRPVFRATPDASADEVPPLTPEEKAAARELRARLIAETPAEAMRSARGDGRTRQREFLALVPIRTEPGELRALRTVLERIQKHDCETNALIPFLKLRTVHFARFVIHERSPELNEEKLPVPEVPPALLFSTNFDGSRAEHLRELVREVRPGLDAVFSHCVGYPGAEAPDRAVVAFLRRHRRPANTFYVGTARRTVLQIRREARLRDAIQTYLDASPPRRDEDPADVRERIRDWVFGEAGEEFAWARVEPGPLPRPAPVNAILTVLGVLALALAAYGTYRLGWVVPALLAAAGVAGYAAFALGLRHLRRLEATDPVIIRPGVHQHTARLAAVEDQIVQNQMSSVIWIKPGLFRRTVLRGVLAFINFAARYISNTGTLAGIPSIHFARWVVVDGGRRLVFLSNFDGSWENYLGDFIDKASTGLTAVWSNCVGFPRTRDLLYDGATDERKFKAYSRDSQIPTQVWYSAYRWLSVENVNNNSSIRLGLYGRMSRDQAAAWLRRL